MPEITDRTKHDHISGFSPILVYRLIATERRLTFDILSQDISTICGQSDEPSSFKASNGIRVATHCYPSIDEEDIYLMGRTGEVFVSPSMEFESNDQRDEAHAAFTKALNEWAVFNKGRAHPAAWW